MAVDLAFDPVLQRREICTLAPRIVSTPRLLRRGMQQVAACQTSPASRAHAAIDDSQNVRPPTFAQAACLALQTDQGRLTTFGNVHCFRVRAASSIQACKQDLCADSRTLRSLVRISSAPKILTCPRPSFPPPGRRGQSTSSGFRLQSGQPGVRAELITSVDTLDRQKIDSSFRRDLSTSSSNPPPLPPPGRLSDIRHQASQEQLSSSNSPALQRRK
ncbi:hypothetical protein V8E36_005120 [Tilletia maclaganii]